MKCEYWISVDLCRMHRTLCTPIQSFTNASMLLSQCSSIDLHWCSPRSSAPPISCTDVSSLHLLCKTHQNRIKRYRALTSPGVLCSCIAPTAQLSRICNKDNKTQHKRRTPLKCVQNRYPKYKPFNNHSSVWHFVVLIQETFRTVMD